MAHKFVSLGAKNKPVYLYEKTPAGKFKKARQVLWGDYLRLDDTNGGPDSEIALQKKTYPAYKLIWGRPEDGQSYYVRQMDTQDTRPLEIIFLDVGQGDGAIIIGPGQGDEERIILVDAGIGDNMDRFLNSRFRYKRRGFHISAAVITHPDKDHYNGFAPIFDSGKLKIDALYHNGLIEQAKSMGKRLGRTVKAETGGSYHIDLMLHHEDLVDFYGPDMNPAMNRMLYPQLLNAALENGVITTSRPLMKIVSADEAAAQSGLADEGDPTGPKKSWMPEFAPKNKTGFTVEVMGPVAEIINVKNADRAVPATRDIGLKRLDGSDGKTKNGHSVLLRLKIGDFSIMLGGDLNATSEKLILQHYADLAGWPKTNEGRARMIASARNRLRSDVLKVCHHGSSDATDEFLQAVDPAAFVISSGDEEGHVHPRPDLLGRLGRNGRGFAPLILSTELQRSAREGEDEKDQRLLEKAQAVLANPDSSSPRRAKAKADFDAALARLMRSNISVYGAIHVKTDGERLIVAFKKETDSLTKRWFYYEYERDANGTLVPLHEV